MKIRTYIPDEDSEKTIWIPTGFLFSRVGMYFLAKLASAQARKEYEQKLTEIEIEHGATPVWLDFDEALEMFSRYTEEKREDIYSLYMREYTALTKYKAERK